MIDSLEIDEVFGDIRELRGQLDGAGQYAPVMTGAAQEHLLENIAHFNSALKGFVKRRQRQDAMLTAKAAHDLYALMSMTESMFQTYRELLDDTVELAEGQDKLELTFGSEPTAPNVGSL